MNKQTNTAIKDFFADGIKEGVYNFEQQREFTLWIDGILLNEPNENIEMCCINNNEVLK